MCVHAPRTSHRTQVVLTSQHVITSQDPWDGQVVSTANGAQIANGNVNSGSLLNLFNQFANNGVQSGALPQHDNHVLVSGRDFESSVVGLAGLNVMCAGQRSGNVNMGVASSSNAFVGAVITHEVCQCAALCSLDAHAHTHTHWARRACAWHQLVWMGGAHTHTTPCSLSPPRSLTVSACMAPRRLPHRCGRSGTTLAWGTTASPTIAPHQASS